RCTRRGSPSPPTAIPAGTATTHPVAPPACSDPTAVWLTIPWQTGADSGVARRPSQPQRYAACMTTTQIAVRLPSEQLDAIDRLVGQLHASRSDVVRRALELYIYRLACEHDAA